MLRNYVQIKYRARVESERERERERESDVFAGIWRWWWLWRRCQWWWWWWWWRGRKGDESSERKREICLRDVRSRAFVYYERNLKADGRDWGSDSLAFKLGPKLKVFRWSINERIRARSLIRTRYRFPRKFPRDTVDAPWTTLSIGLKQSFKPKRKFHIELFAFVLIRVIF